MKRFSILFLTLILILVFSLTGCGGSDKKVLKVYNWGDYIDPKTLEIKVGNEKIQLEYSSEKKSEDNKIAIIQPPDKEYDETQLVYVQTDRKEIYKKYNLNLIELENHHIDNLDDYLPKLLLDFGIRVD